MKNGPGDLDVDDPHIALIKWVLQGLRHPAQRVLWVEAHLPRTAAMLGFGVSRSN